MTTERWMAGSGVGLTWTAAFGTELNSIANGNAILSSIDIDNSTALDIYADFSTSLGSVTSGAGAPYLGIYLFPLNQDGTTYGDGRFGTTAAGPPAASYRVGGILLPASATGVLEGMVRGIIIPPGHFKFVLYNQAGVALAASANTAKYRTYNRQSA